MIENRITCIVHYMMEGRCESLAAGHTEHFREASLFNTPTALSPLLVTVRDCTLEEVDPRAVS